MKTLSIPLAVCLLSACGDVALPGDDPRGSGGDTRALPPSSGFSCDDLDGSETACLDFNDDSDPGLDVEGGRWAVRQDSYVGWGPDAVAGDCTESLMTHALVPDVEAQDLHLHARLTSVERVDKVLVLRSRDRANRLQLNFRATDVDGSYGDLMVQEIRDCAFRRLTGEGEIPVPHALGAPIDVDVDLVGAHLLVEVDGRPVLDRDVDVAVASGRIGFGIIDRSITSFDDVVMTSLDPQ